MSVAGRVRDHRCVYIVIFIAYLLNVRLSLIGILESRVLVRGKMLRAFFFW